MTFTTHLNKVGLGMIVDWFYEWKQGLRIFPVLLNTKRAFETQ